MTALGHLLNRIKLEVEQPVTGLRNQLANPSGDLGAWAWLTAIGQIKTGSDVDGPYLEYVAPGGIFNNGPISESFPVTPGQYVAASWYVVMNEQPYVAAEFAFQDAAGAFISNLPAAPVFTSAIGARQVVAPQLVPAGAVSATLLFLVSTTSGGTGGSTAGKRFRFRQVTVATAVTAAELGPTYTNKVTNPSFQNATHSWTVLAGTGTLSQATDGAGTTYDRDKSLKIVKTGSASLVVAGPEVPVTPGNIYSIGAWVSHTNGGLYVGWYTSAHALIYTELVGWNQPDQLVRYNMDAPGNAAYVRLRYNPFDEAVTYIDACKIIDGASVDYFDGSFTDTTGVDYSWTGTADASTSTKSLSALPYIEPITYQEITGSAVSVTINRRAFDSDLTVEIRDALLDPSSDDLLRPGRSVVASVLDADDWQTLFTGTVDTPTVDYGDIANGDLPAITLTAYGAGAELAAVGKKYGVATIAALPQVLEGVRIPFKVNGSTDQVPDVPAVSSNDQATALDQVILTRDSTLGYAWVTKEGVLYAYSDRALDYYGTGTAELDETAYSGLSVTFDPTTAINTVSVVLLRFNTSTGETEEVTYGPYTDPASVREWRARTAEFRVHGISDIDGYAADILAANSVPQRTVNSMRVPIRDTDDLVPTKALIDLYALAHVTNTELGLDLDQRVLGITHTITASNDTSDKWLMDLTFTAEDTVAAPLPVTPVGDANLSQDGVWIPLTLGNSWTQHTSYGVPAYMRKNGIVYLKGVVRSGTVNATIFTLPTGYRPSEPKLFNSLDNGSAGRLEHTGSGAFKLFTGGSNAYLSFDGIDFPAEA